MNRNYVVHFVSLFVATLVWGCGGDDSDDQTQTTVDAGDVDGNVQDVPDSSKPDGDDIDSTVSDADDPDTQDQDALDSNVPDANDSDVQNQDAPDDTTTDSGTAVVCPSCDELLTWDTTSFDNSTYGEISTANDWGDAYAHKMLDECPGWSIFEGHAGGIGDTLEIASCDDGLVLRWAYESFTSIQLSQGWTGTTNTQIVIGSSYQDFVQAYPDYDSTSTELTTYGYAFLKYDNGFATFEDSVLTALNVY